MKLDLRKYLFVISLTTIIAILFYIRLKLVFSYSLDLVGLEYYFIHIVQQVVLGQPIYPNPEALPYNNCLYTPVYYYIYRLVVSCFNINIYNDIYKLLVIGRFLSIGFVIAQLFYLTKLTRFFTKSRVVQLTAIVFYLLLITEMMFAVRPDSLKVFFFMVFLYHIIIFTNNSEKPIDGFICIAAGVLAVYTKQDISVHLVLCFIAAFLISQNKKIIRLFFGFIITCSAIFFTCILFYGKYFFHNIVFFNIQSVTNLSSSYNLFFIAVSLIRTFPFFILSILNWHYISKHSSSRPAEKFICLYSIILYFVAHLSMLRAGSNFNYTYELIVLLILNAVLFYKNYNEKILKKRIVLFSTMVFFILYFISINAFIGNYIYKSDKEKLLKYEYSSIVQSKDEIKKIIEDNYAFFPNTKYSVFYTDKHIILGHDMHLDRFVKLYFSFDMPFKMDIKTKLPFINTAQYDKNFKDGTIPFIITDNTLKSAMHVYTYYRAYQYYRPVGNMVIYKFSK